MDDWFTVERIDEATFAISEYRHWEETHCYLLLGEEKALLIDTGLGVGNIRAVVESLTGLPLLVATTHVHWDHIGGHRHFDDIAVHAMERDWLASRFPIPPEVVKRNLLMNGPAFPPGFDVDQYRVYQGEPTRLLHDLDRIELGNRAVTVYHTPGHSPGHVCYYEEARKHLYSGDLIYRGTLYAFYPSTDPALFLSSVQRIRSLPVRRLLPGHHRLDVEVSLIEKTALAFEHLQKGGQLVQGNGLFAFGDFCIHL